MKKIIFLITFFSAFLIANSQVIPIPEPKKAEPSETTNNDKLPPVKSTADKRDERKIKLVYGGGLGFTFNSSYLSILLAPEVGARLTDWLLIGVSPSYQFAFGKNVTAHIWGIRPYIQPTIKDFFVHVEYAYRSERATWEGDFEPEITNYNSISVGIGYTYPVSNKVSVYVLGLLQVYQWNKDANQGQYFNPVVRVGVNLQR